VVKEAMARAAGSGGTAAGGVVVPLVGGGCSATVKRFCRVYLDLAVEPLRASALAPCAARAHDVRARLQPVVTRTQERTSKIELSNVHNRSLQLREWARCRQHSVGSAATFAP